MLETNGFTSSAAARRFAGAHPPRWSGSSAMVLDQEGVVERAGAQGALTRTLWIVEDALDGITLTVRSGSRRVQVRLIGVDAPEGHVRGQRPSPWAAAAQRKLRSLAPRGAQVHLMFDQQVVDEFGRLLAYVVRGRRSVNLDLLHSGWAVAYPVYPNLRLLPQIQAATAAARAHGRGIFNPSRPLPLLPYELRQRAENRPPSKICGDTRTRRYYSPPEYQRVPVAARVFFHTEAQAQACGYSPAVPLAASMGGLVGERFESPPVQAAQVLTSPSAW